MAAELNCLLQLACHLWYRQCQCNYFLIRAVTLIDKDSNEIATEIRIFILKQIFCRWLEVAKARVFVTQGGARKRRKNVVLAATSYRYFI